MRARKDRQRALLAVAFHGVVILVILAVHFGATTPVVAPGHPNGTEYPNATGEHEQAASSLRQEGKASSGAGSSQAILAPSKAGTVLQWGLANSLVLGLALCCIALMCRADMLYRSGALERHTTEVLCFFVLLLAGAAMLAALVAAAPRPAAAGLRSDAGAVETGSSRAFGWPAAAACAAAAAALCSVPFGCGFITLVAEEVPARAWLLRSRVRWLPRGRPAPQYQGLDGEHLSQLVQGEALLALALPWLAAGLSAAAWRLGGPLAARASAYALAAAAVLRSLGLDAELLSEYKAQGHAVHQLLWKDVTVDFRHFFPYTVSKLELLDAITDGLSLVVTAHLEGRADFRARLASEWEHGGGASRFLAPGVEAIGLTGLMAVALAGATLAQLAACIGAGSRNRRVPADVAGLGALAEAQQQEHEGTILLKHGARVMGEALPQMLLQLSALGAAKTALLEQPTLLTSLTIGIALLAKKGVDLCKVVMGAVKEADLLITIVCLIPAIAVLTSAAYFTLKIVMLGVCAEHAWTLAWPPVAGCLQQ